MTKDEFIDRVFQINAIPRPSSQVDALDSLCEEAGPGFTERSVMQTWTETLGLRHQGVLVASIRGCDTAPKDDASKMLARCLRNEILNCHCGDASKARSFIEEVDVDELGRRMFAFLKNCDHYPQHYVAHLMHAAEIVGYKKPSEQWLWFYQKVCFGLHVNPETEDQLDLRLNADEDTFMERSKI